MAVLQLAGGEEFLESRYGHHERRADMERKVDPITLAVVAGLFESTVKEMSTVTERTARSPVLKDGRDLSSCLFDSTARLVAQGADLPVHIVSMAFSAKGIADYFGDDIYSGDVIYHNDPETGGGPHLQDVLVARPVFYEDELLFWAGQKAHMVDMGGFAPGGFFPLAEEIYQEGLRIPPVKLFEKGKERRDVINFIMANVRHPDYQLGDLKAQIAATAIAERNLLGLLQKYGKRTVIDCIDEWFDLQERLMREQIRAWPDGIYEGSDWKEDVRGTGDFEIKARVTVKGDELRVDIESPKQVQAYINSYESNTTSAVYIGILSFAALKPPYNGGLFRPIRVNCGPKGTVANAVIPAPCGNASGLVFQNIIDAVRDAMSKAVPFESLHAGWQHSYPAVTTGINLKNNKRYTFLHLRGTSGGAGAVVGMDGWPCISSQSTCGGMKSGNMEVIEHEYPIMVHKDEFRTDSGCAGKWRGGLSLEYVIEPIGASCQLISCGEGERFPAMSLGGAESKLLEPKLARRYILRGKEKTRVPNHSMMQVNPGERIMMCPHGGGGVGDPLERDPEAVKKDVENEAVSIEGARGEYGVIIDTKTHQIDFEATRKTREAKKR